MERIEGSNKRRKSDEEEETEVTFNFNTDKRRRLSENSNRMGLDDQYSKSIIDTITGHFDKKTSEITASMEARVKPIEQKLETHSKMIEDIQKALKQLEDGKVNENIAAAQKSTKSLKEERYWTSRRTGRLWCVEGSNEDLSLIHI